MANEAHAVQSRITAFWDAVADGYDVHPGNVPAVGSGDYDAWMSAIRALLPEPPVDVLDVGTGTGFVALVAAQLGHRVTGVDLSARILEQARNNADARGLPAVFTTGDAVAPPFSEESFDVVINRSLIWTLREIPAAFGAWYRLLRPGGRLVAIYGLSTQASAAGEPSHASESPEGPAAFFASYYTPETQRALKAMHLTNHDLLVDAAATGGFVNIYTTPLPALRGWQTAPGSEVPCALVGYRARQ
jgi:ubiquinone/menaquinone biosynthesis C-methylase UbiE